MPHRRHHPLVKNVYREAAISRVSMKVRLFLEANPTFMGDINVIIIMLKDEDFATADKKGLEKLVLNTKRLNALKHERIQAGARRRVLDVHRSVKKIDFTITENHVYAHITVVPRTKKKTSQK